MVKAKICGRSNWLALLLITLAIFSPGGLANAQDAPVMVSGPGGRPSPEQMKQIEAARAQAAAGQPGAKPAEEPKKEGEKKEGEGDKKKEEEAEGVKQPDTPPRTPDPREFEVKLDENGRVPPFNFIGQPWPDVMQWFATQAKCSLNWQELPKGYLNLTTQRSYSLDELRDLINRHLNARGYTAVQMGEDLSVYKIDKLDPSLVRRVSEEELYDLAPYDFVKITFELPSGMEVDKAKEDVKQVLSPNAKIFPLVTTKRLLVMDSVANLRLVSALLNEERAVQDGRIVPNEFPLKYARPEKVIDILYVVLGMDPASRPTQMELQLQQQKLQLMTQMQQQGKDIQSMLKKDGPPVYLAYNKQRNSIIANAPPEQMKIIKQTIAYLDVPFGDASAPGDVPAVGGGDRVMKKYPLATLDPETFIMTLEEIGGLSPAAEFKVDKKSKTLFALATEADHKRIDGLIDQFDGSGRKFEVIWLRRLPADAVAASIYNLMAGQTEEEDDDQDRYPWYYGYGRGNEEEKEKPVKGFGVDADIENNRLLLWANEAEMQRVRELLMKLGEIPGDQQDSRPVRFVQPGGDKSTAELLQQLRDAWSATGNNELIIKVPPEAKTEAPKDEKKERDTKTEGTTKPAVDRSAAVIPSAKVRAQFVQLNAEQGESADPLEEALRKAGQVEAEPVAPIESADEPNEAASEAGDAEKSPAAPAPVTITVTEDGRLMLSSQDTAALDRMEELIEQLTPPDKRFKVYRLKHITALNMYWNLTDFFGDDLKEDSSGYTRDWYGFMMPKGSQDKGGTGLAKRRKLMITYDTASNTILVANASPSQLYEIQLLIDEYDKPAPRDSVRTRKTAPIKVHFSKASTIAEALKEVYRDLLSSKDKEFDRGDQNKRGSSQERVTVFRYGEGGDDENGRPSEVKVGFEGALSLGVDDISNMIVVSVQEELFESVVATIRQLDMEAAPKTVVHVHRVNGNVSAEALRETIDDALSKPWIGGRPEQEGRGRGDRGRRGDGDRDRDRGRGDRGRDRGNDNNNNNDNDND